MDAWWNTKKPNNKAAATPELRMAFRMVRKSIAVAFLEFLSMEGYADYLIILVSSRFVSLLETKTRQGKCGKRSKSAFEMSMVII